MKFVRCWLLVLLICSACMANADGVDRIVVPMDGGLMPSFVSEFFTRAELTRWDGKDSLKVRFEPYDYPKIEFFGPMDGWNWSDSAGLITEIYNPEKSALEIKVVIDSVGKDGKKASIDSWLTIQPGTWGTLRVPLPFRDNDTFWGMRGIPIVGPVDIPATWIDLTKIKSFQFYIHKPTEAHTLIFSNIHLYDCGPAVADRISMPFVDKFGQYKHDSWPGKLACEEDLAVRRQAEEREFAAVPQLPQRSRFGGWTGGPKLKATGWFRTQKVKGVWWLVDPDGYLFFSNGIDCVGLGDHTFITSRDKWFDWLPSDQDVEFKECLGEAEALHMADKIKGKGRVFSFYRANLIRKYGENWFESWRNNAYKRLCAWGFNTLGNWCDGSILSNSKSTPFVSSCGITGDFRRVEGGTGFWGMLVDAYDPAFAKAADDCISFMTRGSANNPLCIGYFVDNEFCWDASVVHTLASPKDQPCRIEFISQLKKKYGSIEKLNKAWHTEAADWDSLKTGGSGEAFSADADAFEYDFAAQYFKIVRAAVRKYAPNQLYLGCRICTNPKPTVRACAEYADVVSFNLYSKAADDNIGDTWASIDRPVMIGEFHFGARDRGMFHGGLVPVDNQVERGRGYSNYVKALVRYPEVVGCHWFQYVDSPITGRYFDGENYNIGFVDVTDTPYPELVESAKSIHKDLYKLHSAAKRAPAKK